MELYGGRLPLCWLSPHSTSRRVKTPGRTKGMSRSRQLLVAVFWVIGVGVPTALLFFVHSQWFVSAWAPLLLLMLLPGVFGWLLAEPLELRKSLLLAGSASLLAWSVLGYIVWQWTLFATSVRNIEVLRSHCTVLSLYQEEQGRFPESLQAAAEYANSFPYQFGRDAWGNALEYQERADAYILVSFGRGGEPEGLDYWAERDGGGYLNVCEDVSADCLASDLGIHRACGK